MKRCVMCSLPAEFEIKGSGEYYCKECGEMQFGSTDMLVTLKRESRLNKKNYRGQNNGIWI